MAEVSVASSALSLKRGLLGRRSFACLGEAVKMAFFELICIEMVSPGGRLGVAKGWI